MVVPVKKPPPGSLAVTTVGTATAGSGLPPGSTPNIFAATGATPKSMINTTGIVLKYFCDAHFSFFFLLFWFVFVIFSGVLFCYFSGVLFCFVFNHLFSYCFCTVQKNLERLNLVLC